MFQVSRFRFHVRAISMATINKFEDLEIWQLARDICRQVKIHIEKEKFSKDFTLKDQIKRSSGSSMDNIAEGFERDGNREFIQFLSIGKGSIGETRSQTYRAYDYGYISKEECELMVQECIKLSQKMGSFITYLKNSELKGLKFRKDDK